MGVTKLSVSVDEDVAQLVKSAAQQEGTTVSAWMTEAAAARIRNEFLGEIVDEVIADLGLDDASLTELARVARSTAVDTAIDTGT
jgi:DNA-binding response OmpR family regulator